jgi:hypothetical protein
VPLAQASALAARNSAAQRVIEAARGPGATGGNRANSAAPSDQSLRIEAAARSAATTPEALPTKAPRAVIQAAPPPAPSSKPQPSPFLILEDGLRLTGSRITDDRSGGCRGESRFDGYVIRGSKNKRACGFRYPAAIPDRVKIEFTIQALDGYEPGGAAIGIALGEKQSWVAIIIEPLYGWKLALIDSEGGIRDLSPRVRSNLVSLQSPERLVVERDSTLVRLLIGTLELGRGTLPAGLPGGFVIGSAGKGRVQYRDLRISRLP